MLIKVSNDRSVEIEEENFGTQNENRIETLSFELPEEYSNFTKKIVFITNDGNYWDLIEEDDTYILKNNITKFRKFYAYVWLVDSENNVDFRSKVFKIELNKNENPDDYTPSEEQISGFDTMMQELNEAIEEVRQLPSMKYEVVEELPTEDIDTHTIYLILREEPEGNNYYDEYLYINNSWEKIGSTDVDLSDLIDDIENLENRVFSERNVESESNTLILENTEEDMGLEISEIDGWTEQDSTTGKNLFPRISFSRTISGVTITANNDGIVTIKGTATEAVNHPIWGSWASSTTLFTIPAGTYTASGIGTRQQSPRMNIVTNGTTSIFVTSTTQTLSTNTNVTGIFIWVDAGTTVDTTFKYQIEQGTTATEWEPYTNGASPNPSYPQDINVATGTQEVVVSNKNFFNSEIKIGNLNTNTGEEQTGYYYAITSNFVKVIPNSQISIQYAYNYDTSIAGQIVVYQYGENKNFKKFTAYSGKSYSITLDSDTYYIKIRFGGKNDHTNTISEYEQMQIEYGTATTYVPYQEQTQQLRLGDIELAKIGSYVDRIYKNSDKWYIEKNIGKKDDIKATDFSLYNQSVANNIYQFRTANQYLPSVQLTPDPFNIEDIAYSNYFLKKAGINNLDNYYFTITGNGALAINVPYANSTSLANWMNGKTIEVYYQMATPTITEITDTTLISDLNALQHLKQYNDTTIITIDDIREYQVTLESDRIVVIENEQVEQNDRIAELEEENSYLSSIVDQIIPKETAEGSSITLDNTLQAKLKLNERKGDTQQETTNGYNLLNMVFSNDSSTLVGMTFSHTASEFSLNGTANATYKIFNMSNNYPITNGTTYTFKATITGTNPKMQITINCFDSDNTLIFRIPLNSANSYTNSVTADLSGTIDHSSFVIESLQSGSAYNMTAKLMLETGTTVHDYEPYTNGASPNPTYPQDIEVVRGKNRLNNTLTNKTQQGIEFIVNEDKTIKTNGTATGTSGIVIGQVQLTANETYTLSGCPSNGGSGKYVLSINKTGQSTRLADDTGSGVSYTPTTSGEYDINLNYWYGFNIQNLTFKPMIEKGTQATSYLPYNTLEVVVQNKNLCDGQFRQGGWHDNVGTTRIMTSQDLVIRKGTTLTISTTLDTTQYKYGVVVGKLPYPQTTNPNIYDSGWLTSSSKTFTFNVTGYDIGYLAINVATSDGNGNLTPRDIASAKWQIEFGDTATSYVEHQEQTKTLHLGDIELSKIGTYQDRISKSSGKQLFDKNDYTKGFYFNSNGEIVSGTNWGYAYVPCKPNTTYIASGMKNYSTPSFIEVDENKNFVANLFNKTGESSKTFTTTTGKYIGVSFVWNNSAGNGGEIDTLMLNEGSTALPYEPYGNGKWYIEKNIGKVNLKDISWTYENVAKRIYGAIGNGFIPQTSTTALGYLLCTHYTNVVFNTLYQDQTITGIGNGNGGANVTLRNTNYTSLAQYTTEFTNNTEILYYAKTPTYEEITNETLLNELNEIEKMMSYNGQTNINISGNLPMIINVTVLKNLS